VGNTSIPRAVQDLDLGSVIAALTRASELRRHGLPISVLALIGLLVLSPSLGAGFVLVDDHEILAFSPLLQSESGARPPVDLITRVSVEDASGGRFRPFYWAIRYAQSTVFRSPAEWHAMYIGLGIAAAVLLYTGLRSAGVSGLSALLAGVWLLVIPGISSVWIRLGPQESLASALLLLGALAAAKAARSQAPRWWDYVFVVTVFSAALTKESFAPVAVAIGAYRIFLFRLPRPGTRVRSREILVPSLFVAAFGSVVTMIIAIVARSSAESSYGRKILEAVTRGPTDATVLNLVLLAASGGCVICLLLAGPIQEGLTHRRLGARHLGVWITGAALTCATIVPQLALYRGDGGFAVGRYMLPAGLAMISAVAAGIDWSRRQGQRWIVVGSLTILIAILALAGFATWRDAEHLRVDSVELGLMVNSLSRLPTRAVIAVVADPVGDIELFESLSYQLAVHGRGDLRTRLVSTASSPLADCSDIAAVILFASADARLINCPMSPAPQTDTFAADVRLGVGVPGVIMELFPPSHVEYVVLLISR
jgi:hypothetical protein